MKRLLVLSAVLMGLTGCVSDDPGYGGYDPYPDVYEPRPVAVYSDRYRRPPIYRDYEPQYREPYRRPYRDRDYDRDQYREPDRRDRPDSSRYRPQPDYRPAPGRRVEAPPPTDPRVSPRRRPAQVAEGRQQAQVPEVPAYSTRSTPGPYNGPGPRGQRGPQPYRPPILNTD